MTSKNIKWILLAALGVMIVGGYNLKTIIDEIKGFFGSTSEVDNLSEFGATVSDTEAKILAENLYDAMAGVGTDETTIMLTFGKMANRADYNKVYNTFDKRQYSRTWGNEGDPITSGRYDLTTWLTYELTMEEQNKLVQSNPQLQIFS